jgi:hypothetical protein
MTTPTDEQIDDLWDEIGEYFNLYPEVRNTVREALNRWGTPEPIALEDRMTITTAQVLEFLAKAQKLDLNPEITIFDGDFIIHFDDTLGRLGQTESITITEEGIWKGYGWGFDELMSGLDKK